MIVEKINLQVKNMPEATLTTYVRENSPEIDGNRRRPAVIICPGSFPSSRCAVGTSSGSCS